MSQREERGGEDHGRTSHHELGPAPQRILCLSIEASGDRILAEVLRALKRLNCAFSFVGVGGEAARAEGLESIIDPRDLAAHGLSEALSVLPATLRAWRTLKQLAVDVDGYLFVDAPELSMRLLRWVKRHREDRIRARPVFYLAPPQAWAWRSRRAHLLKSADLVGCLFPFTASWYQVRGVEALHIGHPLHNVHPIKRPSRIEMCPHIEDHATLLKLALFPGSRTSSVGRALPLMLRACASLASERAISISAQVAETPWITAELYRDCYTEFGEELGARGWCREARYTWRAPNDVYFTLERGEASSAKESETKLKTEEDRDLLAPHPVLRRADLAICYAGTSTLESTLSGVPVVTISPLSRLSAYVARRVIKLDHCALPNLILARRAFPELSPWESDVARLLALLKEVMSQAELADGLMNLYHQDIEDVRMRLKPLQSEQVARRLAHAISIRGV